MSKTVRAGRLAVVVEIAGGKLRGIILPAAAPDSIRPADLEKLVAQLEKFAPDYGDASPFTCAVWRQLRKIRAGRVMTYAEIATAIGRPGAARAVGNACGANPFPLLVPCHRVVAKNGLGGYSGGLAWKRALLAAEGAGRG